MWIFWYDLHLKTLVMQTRLAVMDGVGGDTGVKPQHQLHHLPTTAPSFWFFFIVIKII